jgi:hypothetical protein
MAPPQMAGRRRRAESLVGRIDTRARNGAGAAAPHACVLSADTASPQVKSPPLLGEPGASQ